MDRSKLIEAAAGRTDLSLLIANAQLANVLTGEIYPVDVGIWKKWIACVHPAGTRQYRAQQVIDAQGRYLSPGLIDTHVHIESSMLTPANFAAAVLLHGTTTVVTDPHEIANVLGVEGVRYMLEASEGLPLKIFVLASSCVPAVPHLETSGAAFGADEIRELLSWERVIGLAEVMDYMGVIQSDPRMVEILQAAYEKERLIFGHCPQLTGVGLQTYMAAGPDSDHEVLDAGEMLEKIRSGMTIEAHESFHSSNISALVKNLSKLPMLPPNITFCIDDLPAGSLLEDGHIDRVLRQAVKEGLPALTALRIATQHAAVRCRLNGQGVIAAGKIADCVLFDDLRAFQTNTVICDGRVIVQDGSLIEPIVPLELPLESMPTVHLPFRPTTDTFEVYAEGETKTVNVIELLESIMTRFQKQEIPVKDGRLDWMSDPDLCLAAIFERHGRGGGYSLGMIKGFGLSAGAVASTISHDSHNLIVVGRSPQDMALAANTLIDSGGGLICAAGDRVLQSVKLPVAGLLSLLPADELSKQLKLLQKAVISLGVTGRDPMLKVTGLALTVVPEARLSNKGLVDVISQSLVPLVD